MSLSSLSKCREQGVELDIKVDVDGPDENQKTSDELGGSNTPSAASEAAPVTGGYVDGGYGWLIVLSCFIQNMLMDGVINAFGVIYLEVTESFGASASQAAWILSIQNCTHGLVGPAVIFVMQLVGARVTAIIGSFLIVLGILLSAFAQNYYTLYVTFGFLAGAGLGVYEQIGMALVNLYFDKRRGLANGITTTGTGVGMLVFPPLTNYLFSEYGFRGTCIILSAIALHGVIAGMVIISPEDAIKLSRNAETTSSVKKGRSSFDGTQPDIEVNRPKPAGKILEPVSTTNSTIILVTSKQESITEDNSQEESHKRNLCTLLKSACDLSLFRNYKFVFFALNHCLFAGAFTVPSAFMPARAVSYNISKTYGSLLISVMGLSSMITRPLCGILVDFGPVKKRRYLLFVFWVTMAGGVTMVNFGETLAAQMSYAILYGMATGGYISLITLSLGDLIGSEKLMAAYGLASMCMTLPTLLIPAASGFIFDATESYQYIYYFAGSILLLAAASLLLIPLIELLKKKAT